MPEFAPRTKNLALILALCGYGLVGVGLLNSNASLARGQQHAPLPEQCRADLAVWYSQDLRIEYDIAETARAKSGTPNRTETNKLFLPEIFDRQREMSDCREVDPTYSNRYFEAFRILFRHLL